MLGAITVDDKINPTIPLDDLFNSGLNLFRIPDVRPDGQAGGSGGCGKFMGCLFKALLAKIISEIRSRMHSNQQNSLSTYNGGTGTMSHLINGIDRKRQSRCKRLLRTQLTTDSVITRHIPEPPPVQRRTLFLNMSSLKTAVESTTG